MKAKRTTRTSRFPQAIFTVFAAFLIACICLSEGQAQSQRGVQPTGSYELSDIETINTVSGNMSYRIPLASLPPGRSGLSAGISLVYNSKLYESEHQSGYDLNSEPATWDDVYASSQGGWRFATDYQLYVKYLPTDQADPQCDLFSYRLKLFMSFPDGSEHEFRPTGFLPYGDGWYNVLPDGLKLWGCAGGGQPLTTGPMTYYSTDGTFLRLTIEHDSDSNWQNNPWTLSMPDGGRVTFNEPNTQGQRIYDRNNHFVEIQKFNLTNGNPVTRLVDQLGRYIEVETPLSGSGNLIRSQGVGGSQTLTWTVTWTSGSPGDYWRWYSTGMTQSVPLPWISSVATITPPSQTGLSPYTFGYSGSNCGEVTSLILPSGAQTTYSYYLGAGSGDAFATINNYVIRKDLTYNREYDGTSTPTTETWTYAKQYVTGGGWNTITHPDGGVVTQWANNNPNSYDDRLVYKTEEADGNVTEQTWTDNTPTDSYNGGGFIRINYFVKTEYHSVKNALGNLSKTAIKDFSYDKNGNVTQVVEYDWVDYNAVPRGGNGRPTGIPGSATIKRVTVNTWNSPTPDAADTYTVSTNAYQKPTAPNLRNALESSEARSGLSSGTVLSRTETFYDSATTTGNVLTQKSWDSTKGVISRPLTSGNSISASYSYSPWGGGTNATGRLDYAVDANGNYTKYYYLDIGNGTTNFYPTKTITGDNAAGTSTIKRTVEAKADFYTGLSTEVKDTDNNLTTKTTYDVLGRPTQVQEAYLSALERRTVTEYSSPLRRVITRSDKDTVGDGKIISIQHYDQLGRIRLARTLENGVIADAYDETKGIKVQTRYFSGDYNGSSTANPNRYTLVSNSYRASYSYNATSEPSMGWSRQKNDQDGRVLEAKSFSGTMLPTPWGSNSNSTGAVTTEYDANTTTVTDQAGKKRKSEVDGLGRLVNVYEDPTGSNYQTTYAYDALNNLITSTQAGLNSSGGLVTQTRTFVSSSLKRLTSAVNPESGTTSYSYDNNGNLLTKTDARGWVTTNTYDALNRNTTVRYSPYLNGTSAIDKFYDNAPLGKGKFHYAVSYNTETNGTLTYNYDQINSYDALGRPLSKSQNFLIFQSGSYQWKPYTTSATYNLAGNVLSQTYPSGRTVSYAYDSIGRTTEFTGNLGGTARNYSTSMQYTAAGLLTKETFGTTTPLYHRLNYNVWQQLFAVRLGTDNNAAYDGNPATDYIGQATSWNRGMLVWHYGSSDFTNWGTGGPNNNGNILRAYHYLPNAGHYYDEYEYDGLNRLMKVTEAGNASFVQAFDLDRWGNRTINQTLTTNSADINKKSFTIDATTNRLGVPSGQSGTMGYDPVGNLTNDTYTETNPSKQGAMAYDAENQMTSAVNGSYQYRYNADGNRVRRILSGTGEYWMVYGLGGELVAEYNATSGIPAQTNPSKEFGYRGGQLLVITEGANAKWLITDHLGSTRMEIGQGGNLSDVTRHDYLPYGEELAGTMRNGNGYGGASTTKQKFTGYERDDESGLDFAQARYYSSKQGRFTSVDPDGIGAAISEPQSWNGYAYVGNRPTVLTDPSGLLWAFHPKNNVLFWYPGNDQKQFRKDHPDPLWQIVDGQTFYVNRGALGWTVGHTYYLDPRGPAFVKDLGPGRKAPVADISGLRDNSYTPFFMFMINAYTVPFSAARGAVSIAGLFRGLVREQAMGALQDAALSEVAKAFCFAAGTSVWTIDGAKPIEEIQAGDIVLSWDEEKGELEYQAVVRTFQREADDLLALIVGGEERPIKVTTNHLFFVRPGCPSIERGGKWTKAGQLFPGFEVLRPDGRWVQVTKIERLKEKVRVFNFEVASNHNYFVGDHGILVHNDCIDDIIKRLRNGQDVAVDSVEDARKILDRMPELRPAALEGIPGPDRPGTYRGDLISTENIGTNKWDPFGMKEGTKIHGAAKPLHMKYPHYNILFRSKLKAAILITGN